MEAAKPTNDPPKPMTAKEKAQANIDSVELMITEARSALSSIVQNHQFVEQERTFRFKETHKAIEARLKETNEKIEEDKGKWNQGWDQVLSKDNPIDLDRELRRQREACENVIATKVAFVKDLEQEVIKRDHEYVNKISAQNAQMDDFVKKMREQETKIKKTISDVLGKTYENYDKERTNEQTKITSEARGIEVKRQAMEKELVNEVIKKSIQNRDELENIRRIMAEKYLLQRTQLEYLLQSAQKELEDSLAKYHFSMEQLDYDTRILTDNQGEHDDKAKQQVKKITRQKDTLRALKKKYEDEENLFKHENTKTSEEYKKIAENYRKLQERFRKVAYADFNSFREVWNLNENRLHQLVLKIIEANNVITAQQLGKEFKIVDPKFVERRIIGTEEFEDLTKTPQAPVEQKEETPKEQKTTGLISGKKLSENLEHLWRLVSDEVGFLVDERVKNLIGLPEDEDIETSKMKIRVDLLLQDLGITNDEDAAQLLSHFLKDTEFELETPGFVRPHEVLEGLRRFVEAYHPTTQTNQTSLFGQITNDATQNTSSEVARAIVQLQNKMKKELPDQLKFIENKTNVVTEEMWRIWNAAFKVMQRYVAELEQRAKLIQETESLKAQNQELEMILQRSIESDQNQDLIYAPNETVDF